MNKYILGAAGAVALFLAFLMSPVAYAGSNTYAMQGVTYTCDGAGATTVNPVLSVQYAYPIPASAAATNIVVTMPSLGAGNLHAACNATGFNL